MPAYPYCNATFYIVHLRFCRQLDLVANFTSNAPPNRATPDYLYPQENLRYMFDKGQKLACIDD
jgi:hypothetical protein